MVKSAEEVTKLIAEWKTQGLSKPDFAVRLMEACIGWPYVWGSYGQEDTVAIRRSYMNSKNIAAGDIELIRKRCQVLNGKASGCEGCLYFPNGKRTRCFDCRGFTQWVLKQIGIALSGGGATSQWNTASNWASKGTIDTLPKDKVCCIFRYVASTGKMEHTLFYDGKGHYIHCSGEVKKQDISTYKATHWAIPKGLYDGSVVPTPTPSPSPTYPTIRQGARGEIVVQLQSFLASLGSTLQIDGIFGSGTASAVRAFQKKYGLTVDGIVGPKTWAKLIELAGNVKPPEPAKDEDKKGEYTITISFITKEEVDELLKKYPDAEVSHG